MRVKTLLQRSLTYYWQTNLAVVLGVATAVAVLAGALLVGDSVRASLRELALNRLGRSTHIISSTGFFRAALSDQLALDSNFSGSFDSSCPLIALEAAATHDGNHRRAGQVQVYGVDERFYRFQALRLSPPEGDDLLISSGLARELGAQPGETLLVRIGKPSAIPAESLHGRKDDLGITLRGEVRQTLAPDALGEFSLRPQQGDVRAIFVPLRRLQRALEQDGQANAILAAAKDANDAPATAALREALRARFTLEDLGVKLRLLEASHAISLETSSAVLSDDLVARARETAIALGLTPAPVLSYLANTIRADGREIPYSLVTALDEAHFAELAGKISDREASLGMPILLNEWAARDLGVKPGATISIDYYLWLDEGRLTTKQADFRLAGIIPISGAAADRDYTPSYPGITEATSLADWDPPFPVDLSRVRPIDEAYWDEHRTTPKAFLRLADGQRLWASRYGKLTSLRLVAKTDLGEATEAFRARLRSSLDPTANGFTIDAARSEGLAASRGATDFGAYFTYFSFFIVASALLLVGLFFRLGVEQRWREIGLLRAVGFSEARLGRIFLGEGLALAVAGSLTGLIGAVAYGSLMMYGLRTWWRGAVGTTRLEFHLTPLSLAIGALAGVLTSFAIILWTLRSLRRVSPRRLLAGDAAFIGRDGRRRFLAPGRMAIIFASLGLLLLGASGAKIVGPAAGFFGAGTLLLVAGLAWWSHWLRREHRPMLSGRGAWPVARLGMRNATYRPGRSALCIALIAAAAFIIVAVDAFRREGDQSSLDPRSGRGGYALLAESLLPLIEDPNSEAGREALNLGTINDEALAGVKIARFRLRPGDDASCLNLYQPREPRIIAPTPDFIREGRFAFSSALATNEAERANPWLLLETTADGAVPVIADSNSMTYVLHRQLGEELVIAGGDGSAVRLRLVAALADSVLQGELIMAEDNFRRLFPEQEGYRLFLIETPERRAEAVSAALEERLSDYGFDVVSTAEKLAGFHQVENTYLSTFQSLGGLGLLLGTLGLGAIMMRNVLEQRRELALLRAVGFRPSDFTLMVAAENALLLGCGLLTGVSCALLAILPASRGAFPPRASLVLLLAAVFVTGMGASLLAIAALRRAPLLPALRAE